MHRNSLGSGQWIFDLQMAGDQMPREFKYLSASGRLSSLNEKISKRSGSRFKHATLVFNYLGMFTLPASDPSGTSRVKISFETYVPSQRSLAKGSFGETAIRANSYSIRGITR